MNCFMTLSWRQLRREKNRIPATIKAVRLHSTMRFVRRSRRASATPYEESRNPDILFRGVRFVVGRDDVVGDIERRLEGNHRRGFDDTIETLLVGHFLHNLQHARL